MSDTEQTQLAVMMTKQERMGQDIKEIKEMVQNNYVTQEQFRPIRVFVYGLIGIMLTAIALAVVSLVIPTIKAMNG